MPTSVSTEASFNSIIFRGRRLPVVRPKEKDICKGTQDQDFGEDEHASRHFLSEFPEKMTRIARRSIKVLRSIFGQQTQLLSGNGFLQMTEEGRRQRACCPNPNCQKNAQLCVFLSRHQREKHLGEEKAEGGIRLRVRNGRRGGGRGGRGASRRGRRGDRNR